MKIKSLSLFFFFFSIIFCNAQISKKEKNSRQAPKAVMTAVGATVMNEGSLQQKHDLAG